MKIVTAFAARYMLSELFASSRQKEQNGFLEFRVIGNRLPETARAGDVVFIRLDEFLWESTKTQTATKAVADSNNHLLDLFSASTFSTISANRLKELVSLGISLNLFTP